MASERALRSGSTSKSEVTLTQLLENVTDSRRYMEKQFDMLKSNIDQITNRITAIEMKQSDLEAAQNGSTTRLMSIESKQSDYEQALTFCGDEIKDIKGKLDELDLLRDKLNKMEENQAADNDRVRQLQSDKSLKTLRICGIPKTHNEDLTYIISKLASQISCSQIDKSDLETVFRPKNSDQSPSTTIVVRFSSLIKRDKFYNCRKLLGKNKITVRKLGLSGDNKIYINESLT